jgi:hypothetical protein
VSKLILPESAKEPEPTKAEPPKQPVAKEPPVISAETQEKAKLVGLAIGELWKTEEGRYALLLLKEGSELTQSYINNVLPQIVMNVVQRDRQSAFATIQELRKDRGVKVKIGQERVDLNSYDLAIGDIHTVLNSLPPPTIKLSVVPEEEKPTGDKPAAEPATK